MVSFLSIDEFARAVGVNKHSPHALFLGAGASLSSGMPSAASCVNEWKRSIYISNNPLLNEHVAEISLPSVRARIDHWLRANGIWPADGQDDYGYFIERCHPIPANRSRVFDSWIRAARPHTGYQLLALLAESQLFRSVWTTNFDGLVAKATANSRLSTIEIGIDCQHRAFRQPSLSELVCVSMHGDYRYDRLANTPAELQAQEKHLKAALINTLAAHSLVVSGYSGRDASVMAALRDGLATGHESTTLYWCDVHDTPNKPVAELLEQVRAVGRQAFYVPNATFDDAMVRLATTCLEGDTAKKALAIVGSTESEHLPTRERFSVSGTATDLIKSNALPIRLPSEMFAFELNAWPEQKAWQWLADKCSGYEMVAVPFRQVLALGTMDDIGEAFDGCIQGAIQRVPISENELRYEDSAVAALLQRACIRAVATKIGLDTDGKHRLWERIHFKVENRDGHRFPVHRSCVIGLRTVGGRTFLTLEPTFYVPTVLPDDQNSVDSMVKLMLGYQHNKEYNEDLEYWRKMILTGSGDVVFDFPHGSAAFKFQLGRSPACAAVHNPNHRPIVIPQKFTGMIHHHGMVCDEPNLLFGTAPTGRAIIDTLPIRGIATHGPFDQVLTTQGDRIRLSVICSKAESGMLETFLAGAELRAQSLRQDKEEYLVPYPGFQSAFRVPIVMPKRQDPAWVILLEIDSSRSPEDGTRELARNIIDAVQSVTARERSIPIILTPSRWNHWRSYETHTETFDVHDFVKAYCVQPGIATQFIKQEKLDSPEKCRFWWWLSVALYAKAMRSPWVLQGLDPRTAYVGLGYAIDHKASRGQQIILGCSHLYNSHGQGLQFRLSRIESAIVRGGNPYLSFEDARRMAETIRSLFWESHQQLPERVVVHKLFPFRDHEQRGLHAGLQGVDDLELIEINHEARLRYLSSRFVNRAFSQGGFPVRRGTTIKLTDNEALLWLHGATDAVKPNWTYFQGKRRIPAPVLIRRYGGKSSLGTIATELLGLSKMDWNSGDLYSQLPATVHSSKTIARIGSLLERFGSDSFDYRLFM